MKNKWLLLASLNSLFSVVGAQNQPYDNRSGLDFDDALYAKVPLVADYESYSGRKFEDDMPMEFSLKDYCPTPNNQHKNQQTQIPSCVGQSLGYGAMTIMYAFNNKWTDKNQINQHAFSALFLYNQASQNNCQPTKFEFAFDSLKKNGNLLFRDFEQNQPYNCQKKPDKKQYVDSRKYKVQEVMKLFEPNAPDKKVKYNIQKSISAGIPVIVGMKFPKNFENFKGESYYVPNKDELDISHAMVVVGYDLMGVELMNSFGTQWGNQGFCKMKYEDFLKHCYRAYQLVFDKKEDAFVPPHSTDLKATFEFKTPENGEMAPLEFALTDGKYYQMVRKSTFGQQFQLTVLDLQANKYLYIFSHNPLGKVQLHFPKKVASNKFDVSPLNPYEKGALIFPAPKRAFTKREEGTDYLFILYTQKEYNAEMMNKYLMEMEQLTGLSPIEKFEKAFKPILLDSKNIEYNTNNPLKPRFSAPETDKIIPIILKVDSE